MTEQHRYSTALSHLILAGTGIYCLRAYKGDILRFPCSSYGIIITNSIIGIWKWGNPEHGDKVDSPYRFTTFLQTIFTLPCIVTQIWLNYSYTKELAYLHTGLALLPLIAYLTDSHKDDLTNIILCGNMISLGAVAIIHENYFGLAAAISFAFNYYCFKGDETIGDVPAQDLYNYGLCFFAYFALRALLEGAVLE